MSKNKDHLNRIGKITQWCNKQKNKIIYVKLNNRERLNAEILRIEERPWDAGMIRILFDSYIGTSGEHDFIAFGYEVSDVVEEKNKLIIYKGSRIVELTVKY